MNTQAAEIDETPEDTPQVSAEDTPEVSEAETKARADGWRPLEEFNGEPDDWRDVKEFNTHGELIGALRSARNEARSAKTQADKALERNNQFRDTQNRILTGQISELEAKLKGAVELADVPEVQRIQSQIDDARESITQIPPAAPELSGATRAIEEFNAAHPWINETSPQADFGKAEFERFLVEQSASYTDPALLVKAALNHMESSVQAQFPKVNENRQKASKFSRGRGAKSKTNNGLSMNDLSREEMGVWDAMQDSYKDEAEFLTTVANSRKGVS